MDSEVSQYQKSKANQNFDSVVTQLFEAVIGYWKVYKGEILLYCSFVVLKYCPCPTVRDFCPVLGLFYRALCFSAGLSENVRREPGMLCQKNC